MASADGVIAFVVVGTGVNMYGAIEDERDPIIVLIAGFVVGAVLLAIAGAAPEFAELFAAAYAITSLTTNGKPLITAVNNITTSNEPASTTAVQASTLGGQSLHDVVNN